MKLNLFTKKKPPPQNVAAQFAKERGDMYSYFYLSHTEEVEAWAHMITASRSAMQGRLSIDQKLGILDESKGLLDEFHAWCAEREGGEEYFQFSYMQHERSMYKRIEMEREECTYLMNTVIPAILACDGELQSEFVKQFSVDPNTVRDQIYRLEREGYIQREKKGNSYIITAKPKIGGEKP